MIDLSFLTEEEQEAIMKVLQRDAELKRTEEERVRHLPEKVKDHVQLKNMSGQWFYEAKSKRHRDKIHGADIIRASMRRKPATIAEVGQNKTSKAKISWVNNVNKEGFVPPDLHGIVEHQEEEQQKASLSSKEASPVLNKPEERPVKAAVSSVRQRRNPFNSTTSDDNLNNGESEDRPAIVPQLSKKEIWSVSEDSPPKSNLQNDESDKPEKPFVELTDPSQKELVNRPVPKARKLIHKAADSVSQREGLAPKPTKQTERINGIGSPPRGILKRSSSSSSTDSEVRVSQMLDVQKKNDLSTTTIFEGEGEKNSVVEEAEDSTQNSLEKLKQVRFSSSSGKGKPLQSPQLCHVKEKGDHDILKPDKKKNSGNYAVQSDSLGDRQIPAAKPLGTYLSALQMKTIDGLQEDTSASSPRDSNRSVFPVSESFQTNTVTPKKLETPQKTSSNILSNSNNEQSVNETHEKKSNQILIQADRHQLLAETEAREMSNTNSTSLQQVLDWFRRSSSTEDEELVSMKSEGREPREEVDMSIRRAVLPTEHSGPGMHGTTKDTEDRPFGKIKQQSSISSTSFTSENIQLIKERVKPKTEEANKKQNDKLLTEFGCTRVEEKEHGQEIKQQNQKSNLLEHQGHKLLAQKCESEKAIQEKRRIREIRAFWERDKTIPSHREKGVSINTDASGDCALTGLRESDKLKQSAVYLPKALHDQCKNTLRSPEVSCASQASRNKSQHSFESGPGHAFGKAEGTLQFDEVCECTELPKASNLHPRAGVTSVSPKSKDKDEKETLKGKVPASSQQKPNFQVLSLKEKMNGKSKNQISDSSHFQSLRNFWDTGAKFQSSIDREDDSLPNNTRSIIYERKSKEDKKGRDNVSKQELIKQQTQTPEREKTQKLDSVVCKKSLGSPILRGLNVTHTKNTDSLQLDSQPVISKSQEKMGLPEHEVREYTDKSIVSSKDNHVSLQLQSSGDKDALKEKVVGDKLHLPIEKGENKTTPLDKEEVAETVDKVVLPKGELDIFKSCLKKLEKEALEMSFSLNLKESILKGTHFQSNQCKVFERKGQDRNVISPVDQGEEIGKSTGQVNVSSTHKHENRKSLRKLFREFDPLYLQYQAADKDDTLEGSPRPQAGLENLLKETLVSQPSEYRRVGMKTYDESNSISQNNCSVESAHQEATGPPEEVHETIEKSVAGSKVNGLSSALQKLLEEASEAPPSKPKFANSTAWGTAEYQVKRTMCEHGGEVPQEIGETVERSVAPSKASGLSSALERLLKEASETPPPKPKWADSTVQRTAVVQDKGMTYEHGEEVQQEISETVERSVAPSKASGLSSALERLLKEAPEAPPPKPKRADSTVQRTAAAQVKSATYECDGEVLQEIHEIVEKSVAPSKASGLSSALEKLLNEASETPLPKPKHADSTVQRTLEVEAKSMTYEHGGEVAQEISENIEKSVAPSKASSLSSALERMLKEASETPSPKHKCAESTVQETAEVKAMSTAYEHDGELLQGIGKTTERSALSNAEYTGSDVNFQNQPKEVSEIPASVLENIDKKMHDKIQTSVGIYVPHQRDRDHSQEIQETVEKSSVSNNAKFGEFSRSLEKLQEVSAVSCPISRDLYQQEVEDCTFPSEKETLFMTNSQPYNALSSYDTHMKIVLKVGAPEKTVKASVNDLAVSEIEASGLKRDGAINKIGERNMVSFDLCSLEGKTNMVAIKPFEINEKGMIESTFLEASEQNSEFQALMNFRRATTALKGSEEELNPVLMALKRSADRKKPSKSLEDIPSATSNKEKINKQKEELVLSDEDVSTVTSQPDKLFSNPEKLKGLSKSVPSFLQEEVSGSLMSIYSADFGNVDVKGNIQFAIDYVEQLNELHIFICQCKELAVADVKRQRSDPYVKTYLLPEKYRLGKRKTSVKKKTFNPVYNEILRYKIEKELLKNQSLNISVWHNDTFGRNSFLGEVELDLGTWDWNDPSNKQINWFPLKPRTSAVTLNLENRGEMKLALQYVPHPIGGKKTLSTGEVHIWVKECHNLPLLRGNRLNSFIKCTILPDTSRKSRQKTRTVAKTTNPVFNHTMVYDGFRPEDLKEACIELTVWDHNKLANHFLGGLRIGLGTGKSYGTTVDWMDSTSDETALWEKMMNSPNTWIEDTLPLRMLMVAKLTK
uniref:Synaptotagmin-like protein 2 n=1 Tax=Cyanistes caeruleus TaxID=156563 RepID=A0A8C0U086_CYACU